MSAQLTIPASVSNEIGPVVRLSIEVIPEVKSYCTAPPPTLNPPAKDEVAAVEVAVKMSATTPDAPTTDRAAYGELVPIPTFPNPLTIKVVAEEDPITKDGIVEVALIDIKPNGVVEPKPKRPLAVQTELSAPVLL